jgi:hypothetical protein
VTTGPLEPGLSRAPAWYVRPALEGRRAQGPRAPRRTVAAALVCLAPVGLAACGGGTRQDADEPKGKFQVEVSRASFPVTQKLAKRSNLVVAVRNSGDKTIPDLAVTVDGFSTRANDPELADPNRPIFVINGVPRQIGGFPESQEAAPLGVTAYVNTWTLGRLRAGKERVFRWSVTAVKAGHFKIRYTVAAGLNGKAKAIDATTGKAPTGSFTGTVSDKAPTTRVADDGHTIVNGTR